MTDKLFHWWTEQSGGERFRAVLKATQKAARQTPEGVEIGFFDRVIATLAMQLEYGNPRTRLPERPAFRQGSRHAEDIVRAAIAEAASRGSGTVTDADAHRIAGLAAERIRQAYLDFSGPGLSERQRERKEGTAGAGQELIGSEGPRLVVHVDGRVIRTG